MKSQRKRLSPSLWHWTEEWHTLHSDDLRFKFSQCGKGNLLYPAFKKAGLTFDVDDWLRRMG
jgi:hypothetical protein